MALSINNLIVEVTRECNFYCSHCLRGNQEELRIDCGYVENIFKSVCEIGYITFTGGEPQLAVNGIAKILELAKQYNVDIRSFYVATNGTVNSKEFAMLMMEWYMFCSENELTKIEVSADYYHEIEGYVNLDELYIGAFKFTDYRDKDKEGNEENYLAQGRFAHSKGYPVRIDDELSVEFDGYNYTIDEMYLNAKGNIIPCCDLSYENQEYHIIGNCQHGFNLMHEEELINVHEWCKKKVGELEEEI